jgi:CRISPR-associated (Cas) DxTHG family.
LYDLVEYNNQRGNNKNRSSNRYFNERNFKAHCGFERNITEVAIINVALINNKDKIKYNTIVRYSPDRFEDVVKTLLKS